MEQQIEERMLEVAQTESIKLYKNSRGYNWEIKLLSIDINRLEELNIEMLKRFSTDSV